MQSQKENVKYRLLAHVVSLHLNKTISFETRVSWKRNVNKAETEVAQHRDGQSRFDQTLELELNLVYNGSEGRFEPKLTEFSVVVIYQGKIKSGGYVKYDAAEIVNNNFSDEVVSLQLLQCPDPQAHLEIVFNYEVLGDSSRSLFNELSIFNPNGMEHDLSAIDFQEEDKLRQSQRPSNASENRRTSEQSEPRTSAEMNLPIRLQEVARMNTLLDRFEELARRGKPTKEDQSPTRYESVAPSAQQEEALLAKVAQLQRQLEERDALLKECERKIEVQAQRINELERQVQREQEKVAVAVNEVEIAKALAERESRFHTLYEQTLAELEELRNSTADFNFSKQSMGFKRFLEQVNEVEDIPEFGAPPVSQPRPQPAQQQLEEENMELQGKIASMSHNIAQLFNAAYDYGGAKLLDYLQNSIGLIEQES